jgi:hypoxanthine phosphoribosyltransferase
MDYLILSWSDVYNLTLQLSERIVNSGFIPDVIVGIARGGWIPARILSDVLYANTLQNIRIEYYSDVGAKGKEPRITQPLTGSMENKNMLLVDEVADSGDTLVRSAVLHYKPASTLKPDYFMVETSSWTVYPWETRESIIALVKIFKSEDDSLSMKDIRDKLVFEVGFEPTVTDYFMKRL